MTKYSHSAIQGSSGLSDVSYRVQDAADNRIATCYLEENARLIVDRLNTADALFGACKESLRLLTIRLDLAEICDDEKRHREALRDLVAKLL